MSIFDSNLVKMNVSVIDKDTLFEMMVNDFYLQGVISQKDGYLTALKSREAEFSTGIGNGIAIPHTRHSDVKELKALFYLLENELDYGSLDEKPVWIVIMLAVPLLATSEYMKTLAFISRVLKQETDRKVLQKCINKEEIINFFERKHNDE